MRSPGLLRPSPLVLLAVGLLVASSFVLGPGGTGGTTPVGGQVPRLTSLGTPDETSLGNATVAVNAWPGYAGEGNLSGEAASAGPTSNGTLWQNFVGPRSAPPSGYAAAASPVVYQGLVFVSTGEAGGVLAFNETTGALVWSTTLPDRSGIYGGLLAADHRLFVPAYEDPSTMDGVLYALNTSSGSVEWGSSYGVHGPFVAGPNLVGGTVLEGDAGQGYLYGWTETGNLSYETDVGLPVSEPISATDVAPGRTLAVAVSGPYVVAYNGATGGSYPGVLWSPYALPHDANGSAAQTPFTWRLSNGTEATLSLAIVGDDGGPDRTSDVSVLSLLPSGLTPRTTDPLLASWTTPANGEGFVGSPVLLGERGGNLTFALAQTNGSVAIFEFSLDPSGYAHLAPTEFLPLGGSSSLAAAPVASGANGGTLYLGTSSGLVEAISLASRTALWTYQAPSGFLTSPAVASSRLFLTDGNGTLHAFGQGSTPPGAVRLLLTPPPLPWVEAATRTNLSIAVHVWYTNGSEEAAPGAQVSLSTQAGNLTGNPANASGKGVANVTYLAPSVSRETNATIFVNATWRSLTNRTSFSTVVVPPKLVNTTPLWIAPDPLPPVSLVSGQSVPISFHVTIGAGGPPLSDALATFQAFGGVADPSELTTNASGSVSTVFTAGATTSAGSVSGLTLTVERAGNPIGTYSWVTVVDAPPELDVDFEPTSLLVVADSTASFEVVVNSSAEHPVAGAVVVLQLATTVGNLSSSGGVTGVGGVLEASYSAPNHVTGPGLSTAIEVVVSASGFTTWSGSLALTLVPNATGTGVGPPSQPSFQDPLAGISSDAAWAFVALVVVLAGVVGFLLLRPPPRARPTTSVWDEGAEQGPEVTGRRGAVGPSGPEGPAAGGEGPPSPGAGPVVAPEGDSSAHA